MLKSGQSRRQDSFVFQVTLYKGGQMPSLVEVDLLQQHLLLSPVLQLQQPRGAATHPRVPLRKEPLEHLANLLWADLNQRDSTAGRTGTFLPDLV